MICVFDKIVNDYHTISGTVQAGYFQLGNVKLLQRPKVSEETMIAAGWEDAYGTATVFSVSYSAGDTETPWTQKIILHMTPIKHSGAVLTEDELDEYFDTLIEQTTISGMLAADDAADKLILWVQEVPGTWDEGWERADLFDDLLHRLQAVYYLNEFSEMPTNEELQEFNPNISVNIVYPDYTTNGDAVLQPTECKLKNIAGGNYDLTLVHPIDPTGKWKHLQPGAIIRCPVPREEIENAFAGYEADVYKTTERAELREEASEPTVISYPSWPNTTAGANPAVGMKTSYNGKNYVCNYWDPSSRGAGYPPAQVDWWSEIARYTAGSPSLVTLPAGSDLYFVEDYDTNWYKMSTYYGIVGYIKKSQVVYDRHLTPSETLPRIITEQLFRIEKPTVDTKNRTVSVTAKHVSYDLSGILIKDVNIAQASPGMAIGRIVEGFMMDYDGTIATNLDSDDNGTYTQQIKGKNGIYALLDPDKGIVSTFNAAFKRDNWDLFVMTKESVDRGYRLEYRKNMLGVNWAQDSSGLVTRVVPIAKDETGADLYLPEVWVDSENIGNYPVIKMERLSVSGQVGKEKETGGQDLWTLSDLLDEMRTKAEERFTVDKADQVNVTVTVDFEQLGDTEEYRAVKGLESVLLYDTVTVRNEEINLSLQLYVSEWEWDAIRQKITALKLTNSMDYKKGNVTGYNVQSKSISSEKLMDDVKDEIIDQVVDIIPEFADPEASRPATVTVTDGNPTLSWGTQSKVGTVQGTDLHVTMPTNPDTWRPVQDNLTSSSTTDCLSAKQGKVLKDQIDKASTRTTGWGSTLVLPKWQKGGGHAIVLVNMDLFIIYSNTSSVNVYHAITYDTNVSITAAYNADTKELTITANKNQTITAFYMYNG